MVNMSDFCEEVDYVQYGSICTPIKDLSVLPLFSYRTKVRITLFGFTEENISL